MQKVKASASGKPAPQHADAFARLLLASVARRAELKAVKIDRKDKAA